MTETVFAEMMATQGDDFDAMAPENVSHCGRLGSAESRDVTGQVFEVEGGKIGSRRAGRTDHSSIRARAGIRPNSVLSSAICWPSRGAGSGLRGLDRLERHGNKIKAPQGLK